MISTVPKVMMVIARTVLKAKNSRILKQKLSHCSLESSAGFM